MIRLTCNLKHNIFLPSVCLFVYLFIQLYIFWHEFKHTKLRAKFQYKFLFSKCVWNRNVNENRITIAYLYMAHIFNKFFFTRDIDNMQLPKISKGVIIPGINCIYTWEKQLLWLLSVLNDMEWDFVWMRQFDPAIWNTWNMCVS